MQQDLPPSNIIHPELNDEEYHQLHERLKWILMGMYSSSSFGELDADFILQELHDKGYSIVKANYKFSS